MLSFRSGRVGSKVLTCPQRPAQPSAAPGHEFVESRIFELELIAVALDEVGLDIVALVQPVSLYFTDQVLESELRGRALRPFELEGALGHLLAREHADALLIAFRQGLLGEADPPANVLACGQRFDAPTLFVHLDAIRRMVLWEPEL